MKEQVGPRIDSIPSREYKTCNGCKYFESHGMVFGHNFRKDQTSCSHPSVVNKDSRFYTGINGAKIIEYMTESHENHVPNWCPFLQKPLSENVHE